MRWTLIIPAKALPAAKSRLVPATTDPAHHRALVRAIRADTLAAASAAAGVARVVVVADREVDLPVPDVQLIVQSAPGLNAALTEAADVAARSWPEDGVGVLMGDLPALQPAELAAALATAAEHARAFVADAAGTGTTLLTVLPGTPLRPEFGSGSADRHRVGARELRVGPGLRRDVDTADDLASAARLSLGAATAALLSGS